jgi:CRP/FNR family transcriptional regulator, cyclic AMP receptor protein
VGYPKSNSASGSTLETGRPNAYYADMVEAGELSTGDRDRLIARYGRKFNACETLFREGDAAHEAFLLQEGRVRLSKQVRNTERGLLVLRAGDFYGETGLLDGGTRTSTAVALSDGIALALDRATFELLTERHPAIASRLFEQLILRLSDAEDQVELMLLRDPPSRIVGALLKFSQGQTSTVQGQGMGQTMLAVSPVELSARVGLDVDVVKRVVLSLREQGYIRIKGEHIEIDNLESLRRYFALLGAQDRIRGS